jgi:hypothetical protein
MVIFAPADYEALRLEAHVDDARGLAEKHLAPPGGTVVARGALVT